MKNPSIPKEDEFALAKKFMEDRYRNLDAIENAVKSEFMPKCPLHNLYLLVQQDVNFRAYVFFKKDSDIELCQRNGVMRAIEDTFYAELEHYGRGKRGEIVVAFEYDSDENVKRNYDGDYYLRLR